MPQQKSINLGPWRITTLENHILKSVGDERDHFESCVDLPSVPEMIFADNSVSMCLEQSGKTAAMFFSACDALQLVDKKTVSVEVPAAKDWRDTHLQKYSIFKPFDWTFSTTFQGTLSGDWRVEPTTEGLDFEFLRAQTPILLFGDIHLFEDELGDNGISFLNVRIRVMQTGFFVLQRFFLRVDGSLLRLWDTRLQWRLGENYVLREVKRLDSEEWLPTMVGVQAEEADRHCKKVVEQRWEKLFPVGLL